MTVTLLAVSVYALRWDHVQRVLPEPALRFFEYYEAAGKTLRKDSIWERIAYSYLLTTAPKVEAKPVCGSRLTS
jgi:hypothetical protein